MNVLWTLRILPAIQQGFNKYLLTWRNTWIVGTQLIFVTEHWHNGMLCSRKKEVVPTLCDSMDRTGEHYAKWNKPGGEGHIPYDLNYKWNLINKTNKQNINRDIKVKNNLTVTRGEVGGDNGGKGRRVLRNNYKGHMDKTKGSGIKGGRWVWLGGGGEWWGENADNCTWITIKF